MACQLHQLKSSRYLLLEDKEDNHGKCIPPDKAVHVDAEEGHQGQGGPVQQGRKLN